VPHEPGRAGRCDADRHLLLLAEKSDFLAASGHIDQRPRLELDALEYRAVVRERNLVFGAAVDEFEKTLGNALQRHLAQIENVVSA
jgi:hypothetical protein